MRYVRIAVILVFGYVGYSIWAYWKAGYFSLPELPAGAEPISFTNGLRGIILVPMDRDQRRYIARSNANTPHWFEDTWSTCNAPTEEEIRGIGEVGQGARLDAICYIEADGDRVMRGIIFSVPRL